MADLPRWIDDARVDSAAMLAAFEGYLAQYPESMAQFQSLFVITHCCPDNMSPAWTLPTRKCTEKECRRCQTRRGGYQFRWWHRTWEADYERLCRPGAWKRTDFNG